MKNKILIYGASELVTVRGERDPKTGGRSGAAMNDVGILAGGSVVCTDGVITEVIADSSAVDPEAFRDRGFDVIDARGKTVTPGFVDSHTHLVFGGYREDEYGWRLGGVSYMEIMNRGGGIVNSVRDTRAASPEELLRAGIRRLNSMIGFGVTTVEGKSGYGLDRETELKQLQVMKRLGELSSIDLVATFMGPHARPAEYRDDPDGFIDAMITLLPEVAATGIPAFADIFCERSVFSVEQSRRFLTAARRAGLGLKIHADEIVCLGGAELAGELGAASADHLLQASDRGLEAMREAGVVATLLPITAFSLKEDYARAREMIDRGLTVALATDFNPGSCFSESIPLLIALATNQMQMTIEETITALTINGAAALGLADRIGSIEPGKQADLLVHEFPSCRFLPYHIGVSTVEKVVKRGRVILDKESDRPL